MKYVVLEEAVLEVMRMHRLFGRPCDAPLAGNFNRSNGMLELHSVILLAPIMQACKKLYKVFPVM